MGRTFFAPLLGMLIRHLASVIIGDLNLVGIALVKPEADAPWVIDGDRVLPLSICG